MIYWKQALPQIIAAIIGSSLIVTALSTINSFIFKPIIDISVNEVIGDPYDRIIVKNIGYTPATHLRLTIYCNVNDEGNPYNDCPPRILYESENMTVRYVAPSWVAFLPALTPGGEVL